ncbi:MAG: leucine-rich repeat domain-containing protein [Ruminococcus sp.]|nr:leucine-rich repeat domain-containing protein [Ruminococcus sp.]
MSQIHRRRKGSAYITHLDVNGHCYNIATYQPPPTNTKTKIIHTSNNTATTNTCNNKKTINTCNNTSFIIDKGVLKKYFQEKGVTDVTIPENIHTIGKSAFNGCKNLTSITIPNSVTNIGNEAFYGCSGLKTASLPEHLIGIIYRVFPEHTTIYYRIRR